MLLLLTLLSTKKGELLLRYDTDKVKGDYIEIKSITIPKDIKSTSGLVYSGNFLCFGLQSNNKNDHIVLLDIYNNKAKIFLCKNTKTIGNIISIYTGKLYLDSQSTNSINCITFDSVNLSYFEDTIHYIVNKNNLKIKSLCAYNSTWFIALQKNKKIFDLSHDRIVYSDVDIPMSLFFNSDHRLCFIENGCDLFHCGNDIFKVGKNPTTAIEDRKKGGYWIACNSVLWFIDYDGNKLSEFDLSEWGIEYYNMVDAEGLLSR